MSTTTLTRRHRSIAVHVYRGAKDEKLGVYAARWHNLSARELVDVLDNDVDLKACRELPRRRAIVTVNGVRVATVRKDRADMNAISRIRLLVSGHLDRVAFREPVVASSLGGVRVTADEMAAWRAAAQASGLTFSAWVRAALTRAAQVSA